ncbi:Coiled-coil domain-containing protein r3hcc1l [Sparganum proliferum]
MPVGLDAVAWRIKFVKSTGRLRAPRPELVNPMTTKTAPRPKRPAMQIYLPPQLRISQARPSSCERLSGPASVDETPHLEAKNVQEPKSPQADQHKHSVARVYVPPQLRVAQAQLSSREGVSDSVQPTQTEQSSKSQKTKQKPKEVTAETESDEPAQRLEAVSVAKGPTASAPAHVAQAQPSSREGVSDSVQPTQTEQSSKPPKTKRKPKEVAAEAESDELAQRLEAVSVSKGPPASTIAPIANEFDNGLLVIESREKAVVKVPLGVPSSQVLRPEPTLNYDELQHVIELYDFPPTIESSHLQVELRGFEDSGFVLKWVDDTHCLAVFSSPTEAATALKQISGILMKARPVQEASTSSKWKIAKSPGDWAMPYKRRPPTDSSVANRIISSHLNLPRRKGSPAESEAVKAARERAQHRRRTQEAMWGDDEEN